MNCRFCHKPLSSLFLDLGVQASANSFLTLQQLDEAEPLYPLKVYVCCSCWLVQLGETHAADDIFKDDYVYFSSYSKGWVEHARCYVKMVYQRFSLGKNSFVVEVASNDGYLLQHFVGLGVPCLGIDPAAQTAQVARGKDVETMVAFFNADTADRVVKEKGTADLIVANNVFAHVPDINGFVKGFKVLLGKEGVLTLEFPHLAKLMEKTQFDTIYDEHYCYFSFTVARAVLGHHGLEVFDVETLSTHGGSLRIFARHQENQSLSITANVTALLEDERALSLSSLAPYQIIQEKVKAIGKNFRAFINREKAKGLKIVAFGAAAKGNTFLNYCGVGADVIEFVVDDTPAKQNKFLPQSHIPVVAEQAIRDYKPDVIIILPWNVKTEIMNKLAYVRQWGGRFVTCIPEVKEH